MVTSSGLDLDVCRPAGRGPHSALDDQRVLEFGQRGENSEYETTIGGRGVELCALTCQDLQTDLASGQIMDEIDQMAQVAVEPVEFPRHQRISLPQRFETRLQTRPIIALAGRLVLVEVSRFDAGGEQRVTLQIERLAAVGLRDTHVADQYELLRKRADM